MSIISGFFSEVDEKLGDRIVFTFLFGMSFLTSACFQVLITSCFLGLCMSIVTSNSLLIQKEVNYLK